MRAGGSCALGSPAGFDHDDRLGHAGHHALKAIGLRDRLHVHADDLRILVRLQHRKEVARIDICHIAQRDDDGEADVQLTRKVDQARTERAGLRQERDAADGRRIGEDGGAQAHTRCSVGHAHAVRADDAHVVLVDNAHQLLFTGRTFRADLAEPGGDAHKRRNTLLAAGFSHIQHACRGHGKDAEVDGLRNLAHVGKAGHAEHVLALAVDGIDFAAVAHVQQIFDNCVANAGTVGCTDHGHALRV